MTIDLDEAIGKFLDVCEKSHDEMFKACQHAHLSGLHSSQCKSDYILGCLTISAFLFRQAALNLEVEGMTPESAHSCTHDLFHRMLHRVRQNETIQMLATKKGEPAVRAVGPQGRA